jgi:broad specificity phosphatase PhoE
MALGNVTYIRHGQASLFSDNYDQLSEKGKEQSFLLGSYFKKRQQKIDKIYLGPLNRHIQTFDAILEAYPPLKKVPVEEMEALREHQGYKSLKAILPILLEKDHSIKNLASLPFTNKKDQISHHIRLYDHFSQRWATGEFDDYLNGTFQSWDDFYYSSSQSFNTIWNKVQADEQVLVITSGGPTSVAYGLSNNLSHKEILHFSSSLYNGSRTHFKRIKSRIEVHSLNSIDHLDSQKELITLV